VTRIQNLLGRGPYRDVGSTYLKVRGVGRTEKLSGHGQFGSFFRCRENTGEYARKNKHETSMEVDSEYAHDITRVEEKMMNDRVDMGRWVAQARGRGPTQTTHCGSRGRPFSNTLTKTRSKTTKMDKETPQSQQRGGGLNTA